MNKNSLVSIIIPTFNRGHVVLRAIRSVLNQTYQNLECIVVDDGSTDNTRAVVEQCCDTRLRFLSHDKNRGISAARNTGIKNSRGDFIAFLDSDDEYLVMKIEKTIEVFARSVSKIGMVASSYFLMVNFEKKMMVYPKKLGRIFPHVSTWVFRYKALEAIGFFDERMCLSEDVDFFQRFKKIFRFHFIYEPLVVITRSLDGSFVDPQKYIALRKKYVNRLKDNPRLYAMHFKFLAKDLLGVKRHHEAKRYFLKAFFVYPINLGYFINFLRLCWKKY